MAITTRKEEERMKGGSRSQRHDLCRSTNQPQRPEEKNMYSSAFDGVFDFKSTNWVVESTSRAYCQTTVAHPSTRFPITSIRSATDARYRPLQILRFRSPPITSATTTTYSWSRHLHVPFLSPLRQSSAAYRKTDRFRMRNNACVSSWMKELSWAQVGPRDEDNERDSSLRVY